MKIIKKKVFILEKIDVCWKAFVLMYFSILHPTTKAQKENVLDDSYVYAL